MEYDPDSRAHASEGHADGLLFHGNAQEVVPRGLLLDDRLTPLERNAWQVIRMKVSVSGLATFPTYESLRPFLSSTPCGGRASDETIARALTLLRLSRWLSLVRHRHRGAKGRIVGNIYMLHDEPLSTSETIQLDPHYFSLVSDSLTHASKAVQRLGFHTLMEVSEDPHLSGRALPSRLSALTQRVAKHGWPFRQDENIELAEQPTASQSMRSNDSSDSTQPPIQSTQPSDSEDGESNSLRNPKQAPIQTVRSVSIYKNTDETVRTEQRPRETPTANAVSFWLDKLPQEQRSGALAALQRVKGPLRQAVLDEWAARCGTATVQNPSRYLFGLIQRALRGEFHLRLGLDKRREPEHSATSPQQMPGEATHTVDQHIEELRALMRIR